MKYPPSKKRAMKEITIAVPDGKKAEWDNGVLTLIDEEVNDNRPIMERIKTFEDACQELGKHAEDNEGIAFLLADYESNAGNIKTNSTLAYMKLCIIAAALNEGWEPQFTEDECRWFPWFSLWTEKELKEKSEEWKANFKLWLFGGDSTDGSDCGLAAASSDSAWAYSSASSSARLAVKSEELADYFGKQFIDIWADYVGPFNRKESEE